MTARRAVAKRRRRAAPSERSRHEWKGDGAAVQRVGERKGNDE